MHCYIQKIVRFLQSASPSVWNENGFPCWKILRRGRPGILPWCVAQYPLRWALFRLQCLQYTSVLLPIEVFFSYQLLWRRPELSMYSYLRAPRYIFSSLRGQHSLLQRNFCGRLEFPIRNSVLAFVFEILSRIVRFSCSTRRVPFMRRM